MKLKNFAFALAFLCLTFTVGIQAQIDIRATIQGQVLRVNNRGIRRARVTVLNLITLESETHLTNDFGYYRFSDLPLGDLYNVTVEAKNFEFPYLYGTIQLNIPVQELVFISNK